MARQRFIWPDLWSDAGFGSLKPLEQVLYIGCFSNADDEGRLQADPALLRATVFPLSANRNGNIRKALEAVLLAMPKLVRYEVGGVQYLQFTNWKDWQKPKYPSPSRLPAPPADSRNDSRNDSPKPSGNDSSTGWVGLGSEEKAFLPSTALEDPAEGRQEEPPEFTPHELERLASSVLGDMPE